MITEIKILQGKAKIVLRAESEFERDLIEKVVDSKVGYETTCSVKTDYSYSTHSNQRIEINLLKN